MFVLLVQHGEAYPESENPARPLTEKGRKESEAVAGLLAKVGVRIEEILHSGKLRAKQTAEVFAEKLKPARGVREIEGLAPNDDPSVALKLIESAEFSLMLVGHLPHLSKLASLLLTGDAEKEVVKFRMAGAVCLVKEERWKLAWFVTPDLASLT